jgi:hypothetical protein
LDGLFADLQRTMKELGIGIFRVESADPENGSFVITVAEDLDFSRFVRKRSVPMTKDSSQASCWPIRERTSMSRRWIAGALAEGSAGLR